MRRRVAILLAATPLALVWCAPALAQTTGGIRGLVTTGDTTPLPGVLITVRSEALIGEGRTAYTGSGGRYSLSGLPVGVYSVTTEHNGFQRSTTENVRVSLNSVATINFTMELTAVEETITVTGESPLVDVASSSVGSAYGSDFIEDLPTSRNMWDLMSVSPGVSPVAEYPDRQVAFGANMQSSLWMIDGVNVTAPESGSAFVHVTPETIAEVQVLGVGAAAEFGNMMGAAFNVVTKSGGNAFHGSANFFWQHDNLTGANVTLTDSEYPEFYRDVYRNIAVEVGGPIKADRLWFHGAYLHSRDGKIQPGVDPNFVPIVGADRFDFKLTSRITDSNFLDLKLHQDIFDEPWQADAYTTPDAMGGYLEGSNPSWAASWRSVLSSNTFAELKYAGWRSNGINESLTGSARPGYVDYLPPDGGPETYSEGLLWPWTYETGMHQLDASVTHYAENFAAGDHDFKFGVQYSYGSTALHIAPGPTGTYYFRDEYYAGYPYYYKVVGTPYIGGVDQTSLGTFVDDSWTFSDKLTLNLGVRFDATHAWIPEYDRLDENWNPTGEKLPGVDPLVDWKTVSPRVGFAYDPKGDGETVIRGSFGIYYDGVASGNFDQPPHARELYISNSRDGPWEFLLDLVDERAYDPDLKAPRSTQYALGFQRQIAQDYAIGAEFIYRDTKDLIGWEILYDGIYEPYPFTDPFTGAQYTLVKMTEPATLRKGNSPGNTAVPGSRYYQNYRGLIFTFNKRFSNNWSLKSSYTWSHSEGLIPRMLSQSQFEPFYGVLEGSNPNHYINADQVLQGDRPHMFRIQGNFHLPHGIDLTTMINLQSGRPYTRQARVRIPGEWWTEVIMTPAGDDDPVFGRLRHAFSRQIDVAVGKRFDVGQGAQIKLDAQFFNLLNQDANEFWQTLVLQEGDDFVADAWVLPRRIMIRLGVVF